MTMISSDDLQKLTVAERLSLIEAIWDSISVEPESVPISEAQRCKLDRRLERYANDPTRLSSWGEVRARLDRDDSWS
jgi:putative addiction module component (TIGR02574 family)